MKEFTSVYSRREILMDKIMTLDEIIARLRCPAGETYTPEKMAADMFEFVAACNDGFKSVHMSLISEMMVFENVRERLLKKEPPTISGPELEASLSTIKALLRAARRANDAIAWTMLGGDRNTIKRLCYRNPKGNLKDQNPESVLETLAELNSNRFNLAIWTDTTTSVDVGDILLSNKKEGSLSCIELKDGKMNRIIFNVLKSGSPGVIEGFFKEYGDQGKRQLKRILKQQKKYGQSLDILRKNEGIDPIYDEEIKIAEVATPDANYHAELDRLIDTARISGFSISLIDDCLWLFALNVESHPTKLAINEFSSIVISKEGDELEAWLKDFSPAGDIKKIYPVFSLVDGMDIPESLPIYLFGISNTNVHDVIMRKIQVFSFINWIKFAEAFRRRGAEFSWSSKIVGRRERSRPGLRRCFAISDRIPEITVRTNTVQMGPGMITRIIYDGTMPTCVVDQFIEMSGMGLKKTTIH
jgi:hypothetical protein